METRNSIKGEIRYDSLLDILHIGSRMDVQFTGVVTAIRPDGKIEFASNGEFVLLIPKEHSDDK